MSEDFRRFIAKLVERTGTAQAVADAIGMTLSAFSRGVRNAGTLDVKHCLLLAKWSGEDPTAVLQMAGKGDIAAIIRDLFGPPQEPITAETRRFAKLPRTTQRHVLALLDELHTDAATPTDKRRRA